MISFKWLSDGCSTGSSRFDQLWVASLNPGESAPERSFGNGGGVHVVDVPQLKDVSLSVDDGVDQLPTMGLVRGGGGGGHTKVLAVGVEVSGRSGGMGFMEGGVICTRQVNRFNFIF
jgi:hypothetical protein